MELSNKDFDDIRPYTDEETVEALKRIAEAPELDMFARYLFPQEPVSSLKKMMLTLKGVDDYQKYVMAAAVDVIVKISSSGLTYSGIENIKDGKKHLLISNHRDIILDPAIIQSIFAKNDVPTTEIAVGDNLLSSPLIADIFRSNRMIKVVRGGTPRERYSCTAELSAYIRQRISSGKSSVWIAQRSGRTKDGKDVTAQAVLKMFEMSGVGDFIEDFNSLSIIPVSISYEFEPCDFLKAREIYLSRRGPYVKHAGEDTNSILVGVKQFKGHIHFHFGHVITVEELTGCASLDKNERYVALGKILDSKIVPAYTLWGNNYIAFDLLHGTDTYKDHYTPEQKEVFVKYMENGLSDIIVKDRSMDYSELKEIFLSIYAGPIYS